MEEMRLFIQQEILSIAFVKVGFDDSLIRSRVLDSISVVDLVVSIEDKIGRKIPQHLINEEHFESIENILKMLEQLS